jgi:type VI secretion system protein VasG
MFLQVFDKGHMEDGNGRHIDFRNTTILLTSNVGADRTASLYAEPSLAPTAQALRDALAPDLLDAFAAAFLGRVMVVPYRPLAHESLARIVRLHLERVVTRMAEQHRIALTYNCRVVDYIAGRCLVAETGARVLIGFIEQQVLPRLSALWLDAFTSRSPLTGIEIDIAEAHASPVTPASALRFTTITSEPAASAPFPVEQVA